MIRVKAIFSNGALTPLEPIDLKEGDEVTVSIDDKSELVVSRPKEITMKKNRIVVVNGREIEMLDVRNLRGWTFPEVIHLEDLCSNLSTEADYIDLWDYVISRPKCDDLIGDQYLPDARATFQNIMLPVLMTVIGYSNTIARIEAIEELPQLINEMGFGSSSIPLNFMSGPRVSQFLHLVRFMGIRYPSLAQGLSRLKRKDWREIEEAARKDGFEFKDTDCRKYTRDTGKSQTFPKVLLPVWIRHRLAHPENKREKDFPTESDYRRAIAILGAAIAGTIYSDTDDNEHSQERLNHG